jgi:hypothetical protein
VSGNDITVYLQSENSWLSTSYKYAVLLAKTENFHMTVAQESVLLFKRLSSDYDAYIFYCPTLSTKTVSHEKYIDIPGI